ncbi:MULTISPECIES: GGDEF domain-containing protein [Stenotrophomonas]|uniref:diguanylate cyclase n=2 Tax=Stenotrophomonas TaxID=40323 RepID=A0A4S2CZN4_STEMA|nr:MULTISPECIES: GGDEF domain-containing protein [Stenotrophomonas]MBD3828345.1 GGDEF domain-containing protein [Stenotrophomonas sp.]QIO89846.1 GGDEF domain-containing protein [Stenotrophomonas rhizophila]TGY34598.1 GGDEF domain-containing protein [Stenotrophomonas maltophilia]
MTDPHDAPPSPGTAVGRLLSRRQVDTRVIEEAGVAAAGPKGGSSAMLQRLFAGAEQPEPLLAAFAHGMSTLPGELGDMGLRLQSAQRSADWVSYGRAMRQLIDKYIRTIEQESPDGQPDSLRLRELLRHTLGVTVASLLQNMPELKDEPARIAGDLRHWHPGQPLQPIEQRLRELTHQIGVRSDGWQEQQELLLSLFDLLLDNIGELLDDSSWLHGQVHAVRALIGGPLDRDSVEQARANLREVIYKQGLLKQGISDSKAAMKHLMGGFIERLDGMAVSTGEYHDRISSYALALKEARSIADLNLLLQDVLQDTGRVQEQALQARDHLGNARREVEQAEARIAELEQELRDVSGLVRTDPLTGALNRRGFDELLERELARAARQAHPLALALIDLDDFHQTNDTHGHAGGDAVLRHLVAVCQLHLRSSDAIARLGGDEFVLLLPETPGADSMSTLLRLQRSLAQRPLPLDQQRVPVHFSAGIAQWQPGEDADTLLRRADAALYAAKRVGKNRVQAADPPR